MSFDLVNDFELAIFKFISLFILKSQKETMFLWFRLLLSTLISMEHKLKN